MLCKDYNACESRAPRGFPQGTHMGHECIACMLHKHTFRMNTWLMVLQGALSWVLLYAELLTRFD